MTAITDPRGVLESTLRELAAIGPRPHASAGNDAAVAYVAERMQALGLTVVDEPFVAPRPQERDAARLMIDGEPIPCLPFLDSVEGHGRGRPIAIGPVLVWGMHEWPVWIVEGDAGRVAVAQSSFPQAVQQHIPAALRDVPSVIVGERELGERLQTGDATVEVEVTAPLQSSAGRSLRAFRGADPLESDRPQPHPLVVAHIDTVPGTPGVYDNAAGVAAAVSLCASHPRSDFEVLISNAEEEGLAGARAFARRLTGDRPSPIAVAVVLDGGGRGRTAEGWFSDAPVDSRLRPAFVKVAAAHGYEATARRPAPPASDHAAFSEIGIPAVAYTVNDLEILHTAEDVYEDGKRDSSVLLAALAHASLDAFHSPS